MRRLSAAAALLAVAALVSACAASQAPNWTYAPPTPVPTAGPSQSAGASAGTSGGASSAPSAPSAEASSGASAPAGSAPAASQGGSAGGGTVVDLTAQNIDWTTKDLAAPANAAFTIHFDNQDASTPHNIVIKDGQGQQLFSSPLLTGVAQADYQVPALAPGTYAFVCSVHPNMTGTLTVK